MSAAVPLPTGTEVMLVDARGCWRLHVVHARDRQAPADGGRCVRFRLAGYQWTTLVFAWCRGGERTAKGLPLLRSAKPALGPESAPFLPIHLPAGWHPPQARLNGA